ncbi:hypothetical protein GCM10027157_17010 [Corynebacterium aquatimens]
MTTRIDIMSVTLGRKIAEVKTYFWGLNDDELKLFFTLERSRWSAPKKWQMYICKRCVAL